MNTTTNILPNYRIYDRTGGGGTNDIVAASLDNAIEQGRAWIEDGDWERDEMETLLDCCVREIVRVPDLSSIEALPGVYAVTTGEGRSLTVEADGESLTVLRPILSESMEILSQREPADDGTVTLTATLRFDFPTQIDDRATTAGDAHDCSGVCPAKDAPECRNGGEHDWRSPYTLVGGCKENPGVRGSGHGQTKSLTVCTRCGLYRAIDYGATNPSDGGQTTRTSYRDADEHSLAWVDSLACE